MGQTVDQIEAGIDRSRFELGANIHELERRVDQATEWREQFRLRPFAFLAAAAVGGAVGSAMLRRKPFAPAFVAGVPAASMQLAERATSTRNHGSDVWDNVQAAALSLVGTKLKNMSNSSCRGLTSTTNAHSVAFQQNLMRRRAASCMRTI
jgi:hypothetical protein